MSLSWSLGQEKQQRQGLWGRVALQQQHYLRRTGAAVTIIFKKIRMSLLLETTKIRNGASEDTFVDDFPL